MHVRTSRESSLRENVSVVFGATVADELVEVEAEDAALGLRLKGLVSNANYNAKKLNFLLFINHRLVRPGRECRLLMGMLVNVNSGLLNVGQVDSTPLRKALDLVYSAYLPKGTHPSVYLSLLIDPRNVDVNVHPTKHEVQFLHQVSLWLFAQTDEKDDMIMVVIFFRMR